MRLLLCAFLLVGCQTTSNAELAEEVRLLRIRLGQVEEKLTNLSGEVGLMQATPRDDLASPPSDVDTD